MPCVLATLRRPPLAWQGVHRYQGCRDGGKAGEVEGGVARELMSRGTRSAVGEKDGRQDAGCPLVLHVRGQGSSLHIVKEGGERQPRAAGTVTGLLKVKEQDTTGASRLVWRARRLGG